MVSLDIEAGDLAVLRFHQPYAADDERAYLAALERLALMAHPFVLLAIFGGKIPFGPVYDMADIAQDPHFAARNMIVETSDPGTAAPVELAGVPIKFTETPGGIWSGPPLPGQHTDQILAAAGLQAAEIADLRQRKIVQ